MTANAPRSGRLPRLSRAHLPAPQADVQLPPDAELTEVIGIVHLGICAFHRAHQALMTQDAAVSTGDTRWGICGVTQRSRTVVDQLRPQDGLYTVLERGRSHSSARIVAQVSDVLFAAQEGDRLLHRLAHPATHIVTMTVTEKGYPTGQRGGLDRSDDAVAHDLTRRSRGQAGSRSVIGQLVRGLQARADSDAGPITVMSCDNLTDNGAILQRLVEDFCYALPSGEGEDIAAFVAASVTFPCSVVDRIVPATTDQDRAEVEALLGVRDEALVVAEPYRQWVIEDHFAGPRPAWERAGAMFVDDVAPYGQLKLRILNGTHSMLAYLGALAGHDTIAEAVADPRLRHAAEALVRDDVIPTLHVPTGIDPQEYAGQVLDRFANPALGHRTTQVAMDGSRKLPVRLLPTARDRLAAGHVPDSVALAVAGWMAYVAKATDAAGRPLPLEDPLAPLLHRTVRDAGSDPRSITAALLDLPEIFGADLPDHQAFAGAVTTHLKELL
ncbi:MAG: mannitol dehydrogenase family protein [Allobranchiibius sp.]